MVYAVNIKWASFKQDISNLDTMLGDQSSTYAILRYAYDIPEDIYRRAMSLLASNIDEIANSKLLKLVKLYLKGASVGIVMDEEFVETIEIPVGGPGVSFLLEESEDFSTTCYGLSEDIDDAEIV